ncbi:hypothetical protein BDV27DRAFT_157631 [Aspergillus caelatus]|uniref:Aminoglycoside phosphotransferase domain-containing protein n=1 Tax=Aspergillus caelatus TaxID=61420 RepID=A0A5N7A522_9EURO|nr:uncharacterized protein BDV27DRAFT_157631 [Aspergillus caelatus]KAE8364683.1 hypothetical protein BDV27DRAFT_157631 [Aspergillus caelatus]
MTTPTTVSHQALAREILQRELAVEVSNISHLGYSRSNFVYKVVLSEPTREAHHGSRKPGTVEIPKDTTRLIIRFFKPFDTFNEGVRAENIVAAMTVARSAMADSALHTIVPQVYGWSSGKEEPSGEAWVLEEYISGTNFGDDFHTLPSHKQHAILAQFAEVVKAFQDYNFPETVKAFGGLAFNADGNVCSFSKLATTQEAFELPPCSTMVFPKFPSQLAQVGALRSSTIDGADAFSRVHWLIQDLVPWHLFDPTILEIQTPEQLEEARKEVEITLGKYLDSWGF